MTKTDRRERRFTIVFIALTYLTSWICWFWAGHTGRTGLYFQISGEWRGISTKTGLILLGNFMPGISAVIVLFIMGAKGEILSLFKRANPLRSNSRLLLFAILIPIGILFLAAIANLLNGGSDIQLPEISFWIRGVLINLLAAPLWEELGWRGFLLPRLQRIHSSFAASLLVGLAWGPWHAPLRGQVYAVVPNVNALVGFLLFCIYTLGLSVILAWLCNKAGGAIFPCIVFHSVLNGTSQYFVDLAVPRDGLRPLIWAAVAVCAFATFLRLQTGKSLALDSNAERARILYQGH